MPRKIKPNSYPLFEACKGLAVIIQRGYNKNVESNIITIKTKQKTLMKNAAKMVLAITATILVIDFLGFTAWVMSGQRPVDNFYVGTITTHAIKAVLK